MRRTVTRPSVALLCALVLLSLSAGTAAAEGVRADLEGKAIEATKVGSYYCHDLAYPDIHCFRTAARLEAALAAAGPDSFGVSATNYVVIYADQSYGGAYAYLSQNYSNLGSIGWNDRITSFKALNGEDGRFYEHESAGGGSYTFCCNQQVSNVGQAWNDRITSVYRL
jgi:hypothetical protein